MLRAALFLIACSPCLAYPCEDRCDSDSGLALDASCTELLRHDSALARAEAHLNDAYELALNASVQKSVLEEAQQAWNQYRQANCELMAERDARPAAEPQAQCLVFMANERAFELRLLTPR